MAKGWLVNWAYSGARKSFLARFKLPTTMIKKLFWDKDTRRLC